MLKQFGAHEQVERAVLVDLDGSGFGLDAGFHAILNPAPALRVDDVHELHAYASAINAPRFARPLVVDIAQVGMRLRRQQAERVQFGFQISKLPEQLKDTFPFVVFDDCRGCALAGISS